MNDSVNKDMSKSNDDSIIIINKNEFKNSTIIDNNLSCLFEKNEILKEDNIIKNERKNDISARLNIELEILKKKEDKKSETKNIKSVKSSKIIKDEKILKDKINLLLANKNKNTNRKKFIKFTKFEFFLRFFPWKKWKISPF